MLRPLRRLLGDRRARDRVARRARRTGRRGERVAARALRRAGYRILARNLRTPYGEIDLLALHRGALVLVEVKSRASGRGPPPEARLGRAQRERLRSAGAWLRRHPSLATYGVRRDLVAVTFEGLRPAVRIHRARL